MRRRRGGWDAGSRARDKLHSRPPIWIKATSNGDDIPQGDKETEGTSSSGLYTHFVRPLCDGDTFTDVLMKASNSSQQGEEMLAEQLKVCDSHMNSCKYVLVSAEGSGRYAKVKEVFVFGAEPSGGPCSGPVQGDHS